MDEQTKVKTWCPVFKDMGAFKKRLERGICWADYIKVRGRIYKMVEYGDSYSDSYMLFQNKPTKHMIEVRYQVPCFKHVDGERVQTHRYSFHELHEYPCDELYRY